MPSIQHQPEGDPCAKCGEPEERHVKPRSGRKQAPRTALQKKDRHARGKEERAAARARRDGQPIVAIDGEGQGREPHLYTYLSAVDETGVKRGSVHNPSGLGTQQCLDFLLGLEVDRVFGFSLGYDFSMMLRDLPDAELYMLVRPELRAVTTAEGRGVHKPIYWRGYKLTYMRRRLGIQRVEWSAEKKKYLPVGRCVVVWDVFAFYQGKFTKALGDWKIGGETILAWIASMKEQRSNFDRMGEREIQKYCDDECHLLGMLVRKLIEAHEEAGLPLASFYGAGSTATALLQRMGVRDFIAEPPAEMRPDVARAFFGGRFEISRVGPSRGVCWNHDISSAYPYELWRLPCLTHGRWKLETGSEKEVDRAVRGSRLALVRCRVKRSGPNCWGPLPYRIGRGCLLASAKDLSPGTILFPLKSDMSWCWQDEYLAAKDTLWPGVTPLSAWCYRTDCDCRPFGELPDIYRQRVAIGKDGAGIVLKLGPNSCYGKTAQSMGTAPFRSWVWAGCVTSGTRAQLLRAIAAAKDVRNVLMLATDSVLARERLALGAPEDTGTGLLTDEKGRAVRKPLGGWEVTGDKEGDLPKEMFLAKPGIYWPLHPTEEELKAIKTRGISRHVVATRAGHIMAHFKREGWTVPYKVDARCLDCDEPARLRKLPSGGSAFDGVCQKCGKESVLPPCVRFIGSRQGITIGHDGSKALKDGKRLTGEHVTRSDGYGEWREWPVDVKFRPRPKRVTVKADGSLLCWEMIPGGGPSAPYDKLTPGHEAEEMKATIDAFEDSADGDISMA